MYISVTLTQNQTNNKHTYAVAILQIFPLTAGCSDNETIAVYGTELTEIGGYLTHHAVIVDCQMVLAAFRTHRNMVAPERARTCRTHLYAFHSRKVNI